MAHSLGESIIRVSRGREGLVVRNLLPGTTGLAKLKSVKAAAGWNPRHDFSVSQGTPEEKFLLVWDTAATALKIFSP